MTGLLLLGAGGGGGVNNWYFSGVTFDDDYGGDRYWNGTTEGTDESADITSFGRALAAFAADSSGNLTSFATNTIRRSDQGWLIEGARTNLALQSQTFGTSWSVAGASPPTADQAVAPDGTTTADLLTGTGSTERINNTTAITISTATDNTWSIFLKRGNYDWVRVLVGNSSLSNGVSCWFNLNTGAVGTTGTSFGTAGWTVSSATIKAFANGFYRIIVTFQSATDTSVKMAWNSAASDGSTTKANPVSAGAGNGTTLYMWGAQLEQASSRSSYIITTTASVNRPADVGTITKAGTSTGTVVIHGRTAVGAGTQVLWQWDDASANNRIYIYRASADNHIHCVVRASSTDQCDLDLGAVANDTAFKLGLAWTANDFAAVLNGGSAVTDGAGSIPTGLTTIRVGVDLSSNYWNGYISRIALWPTRETNGTLQADTT